MSEPSETRVTDPERLLREEWWANHGCSPAGLYGDDGELQCNATTVHRPLDFRRDPLTDLYAVVQQLRLARAAAAWTRACETPTR